MTKCEKNATTTKYAALWYGLSVSVMSVQISYLAPIHIFTSLPTVHKVNKAMQNTRSTIFKSIITTKHILINQFCEGIVFKIICFNINVIIRYSLLIVYIPTLKFGGSLIFRNLLGIHDYPITTYRYTACVCRTLSIFL